MLRSARLIAAGLLAAASFACVSGVQPRPALLGSRTTVRPALLTSRTYCSDADTFFQRVAVLKADYQPNVPPGQYVPPTLQPLPAATTPSNPYQLRQEIMDDLKAAYNNAPDFFKNQLCLLDGVYLSSAGCSGGDVNNCTFTGDIFNNSWGFRSYAGGANDNGWRYIAISAGLWQSNQHALPFDQFADAQLRGGSNPLAPWGGAQVVSPNLPNPDTPWMTVLAALAHEFGHVRFIDVTVPLRGPPNPAGGPFSFSPLMTCQGLPNGNFFTGWSYRKYSQLFPKGRWRQFNDRRNEDNHPIDHASAPFISQFSYGTSDDKNNLFYNLLIESNDPPWPSYFGSIAPDEDFVETYVLGVLTGNTTGYLQSLPVTLVYSNGSQRIIDIPGTLASRTTLQNKIACLP